MLQGEPPAGARNEPSARSARRAGRRAGRREAGRRASPRAGTIPSRAQDLSRVTAVTQEATETPHVSVPWRKRALWQKRRQICTLF